jgi:hypothetical protein
MDDENENELIEIQIMQAINNSFNYIFERF